MRAVLCLIVAAGCGPSIADEYHPGHHFECNTDFLAKALGREEFDRRRSPGALRPGSSEFRQHAQCECLQLSVREACVYLLKSEPRWEWAATACRWEDDGGCEAAMLSTVPNWKFEDPSARAQLFQTVGALCKRGIDSMCDLSAMFPGGLLDARGVVKTCARLDPENGDRKYMFRRYASDLIFLQVWTYYPEVVASDLELGRTFERACKTPGSNDCVAHGMTLEARKEYGRAFDVHERACNNSNSYGCNRLGVMLTLGNGRPRDDVHAAQLFRSSCERGVGPACTNYALCLKLGRGVERSDSEAKAYLARACDAEHPEACAAMRRRTKKDFVRLFPKG